MRLVVIAVVLFGVAAQAQSPAASQAAQTPAATAAAPARGTPLPDLTCPDLATALRAVTTNDARLRDWPALARYREANRTAKDTTVVFMGDSITDNWQQPRFGGFFPGKPYADRGISGQTAPQMPRSA